MVAAICLFLLGACAGLVLAIRHFTKRGLPGWVAIAHGAAGASGFALLLLFCAKEPAFLPARSALVVLVIAIALGCVNVVYHLRRVRHRSALIVAHALSAVGGVGTLAYGALVHDDVLAATKSQAQPASAPPHEDSVPRAITSAPAGRPPTDGSRSSGQPGWRWPERHVQFEKGSALPTGPSLADIDSIAEDLTRLPDIRLVEVQGHADERGEEANNLELSRARAQAVVEALASRGVATSRLRTAAYAARCPLEPRCQAPRAAKPCHDESSWRQDRRVTLLILESSEERFQGPIVCDRASDLIPIEDVQYGARGQPRARE
jgi:outer membrane protein OmpA-like peptidoglycan-associated protein